ncbi:cis-prenyltransferase 4, chloroplastic-like isoform X1 [Magnolia sinica]|uniref:cis-prenyltransferase 4, chloroplastic-like isoform X1 n=1 Tax=Magnolia sinica TaxID=86752 RepID=UPI002659D3CE|nr:cis-prenyltransferase 4, chloroplastic-like isoform X1 [Magnolia sinica]
MLTLQPNYFPLPSLQNFKCIPSISFSRRKSHRTKPRNFSSPPTPRISASSAAETSVEEKRSVDGGDTLPEGLSREAMPRHVAVIMDGNARWARAQGLPPAAGHEAGVRSLKQMVKLSCMWEIKVLTVFAFSSQNWFRPKAEVDFLISLFESVLRADIENFVRENIRLCVIGDSSKLPKSLQMLINEAEEMTKNNTRLDLMVAVSYSGRDDIVQACQKIAYKVKDGLLEPGDITELLIEQELETNAVDFPFPDLLIRTSGELRVSNFLLWQLAYTELFFTGSLWPDFGEAEYVQALQSYQDRQRRFGLRDGAA